jgi:hypothetical protein
MNKITEPVNMFVFVCKKCDFACEESYLVGWLASRTSLQSELQEVLNNLRTDYNWEEVDRQCMRLAAIIEKMKTG